MLQNINEIFVELTSHLEMEEQNKKKNQINPTETANLLKAHM